VLNDDDESSGSGLSFVASLLVVLKLGSSGAITV